MAIDPEYGVPLTADELNSQIPTSILYSVTPDNKFVPVKSQEDGTLVVSATFSGSITIGEIGVSDESSFIYGTSLEQPVGGVYQDSSPTLSVGETGAVRLTQYRAFHINLRDSNGNELIGQKSTANSIPVVLSSDQSSVPVSISNFPTRQSVIVVPSSTGVNLFSTNSIPSGVETTLLTYTTTFPFHISQLIGWGTSDAEFLIYKNGILVGGGMSSPSNRTLNVDYDVAPISSNTGDIITITVSQFFGTSQVFRVNLLGE